MRPHDYDLRQGSVREHVRRRIRRVLTVVCVLACTAAAYSLGARSSVSSSWGVDVEAAILVLRDDTSPGPQAESALKVLEAAVGRAIHAVGASQKRCDRVCQDAAAVLDELVEEIGRIRQKKH